MLLTFAIIHLVPTHFFLYSFYIIPRRFYATEDRDMRLNDASPLNEALVED